MNTLVLLFAVVSQFQQSCNVAFSVPRGWHASLVGTDDDAITCRIVLDPPHWSGPEKSRWGGPPHAVIVEVYAPTATYEKALDEMGFEKDDTGRIGVPGFHSVLTEAEPFSAGDFRGVEATPGFRDFIKDDSLVRPGEDRVYGSTEFHIVAKTPTSVWIGIQCNSGTPDDPVRCEEIVPFLVKSLRFVKHGG